MYNIKILMGFTWFAMECFLCVCFCLSEDFVISKIMRLTGVADGLVYKAIGTIGY